jgi:hypothetical protein
MVPLLEVSAVQKVPVSIDTATVLTREAE